ncbi:MAG: GPR endopeptidase, partial [Bacilli bacterium]|nr:GPR endopeptidase [Bacilli bacterium]
IMKHEIDLKNYAIRTDLIVDLLASKEMDGVIVQEEKFKDVHVSDVIVEKEENGLGKKPGRYVTIDFQDVTDKKNAMEVEDVFVKYLKEFLEEENISFDKKALVVGLGNDDSTPDSLGPKAVKQVLVTKYLFDMEEVTPSSEYRNVASFIPGVMAMTGYESSDIISSLISVGKPDFILVIDALASSAISRVNKTIQISNTGILPGSGIGNKRKELSKETLGIPVISIGVPTVIDAIVLVSDTIQYLLRHFSYHKDFFGKNKLAPVTSIDTSNYEKELSSEEKETLLGEVGQLSEEELQELIFEVLTPIGYHMVVTPKEVDFVVSKLGTILANGINRTLHKNFDN